MGMCRDCRFWVRPFGNCDKLSNKMHQRDGHEIKRILELLTPAYFGCNYFEKHETTDKDKLDAIRKVLNNHGNIPNEWIRHILDGTFNYECLEDNQ